MSREPAPQEPKLTGSEEQLCDELERRPARFLFSVNARPDLHRTLGADLIRRLRAAGFIEFLIGAESGSPHSTPARTTVRSLMKSGSGPAIASESDRQLPFAQL